MKNMMRKQLTFAELLEDGMELRKLNKKQLAVLLDVSPTTISNWCSGIRTPDFPMILKICNLLHIDFLYFIGGTRRDEEISEIEWEMLQYFRTLTPDQKEHFFQIFKSFSEMK